MVIGEIGIEIRVGERSVENTWISCEVLSPLEIQNPPENREVAYYIRVRTDIQPSNLKSVALTFRVGKSWLREHGVKPEDVEVLCYFDNRWYPLFTQLQEETEDAYSFSAKGPVASTFAVTGIKSPSGIPLGYLAGLAGVGFATGLVLRYLRFRASRRVRRVGRRKRKR